VPPKGVRVQVPPWPPKKQGKMKMEVKIIKLTDVALMRRACEMTYKGNGKPSKMTLRQIYDCEHSPMRTQIFWLELLGVKSCISVHLVRHGIWNQPYVESNRPDRGGSEKVDRDTPVNHGMFINAQALINMARKRLCGKAHKETTEVMEMIKDAVRTVDPDLADFMVPECVYRNGCHELKTCGYWSFLQRTNGK
jgi:hypothetical protein